MKKGTLTTVFGNVTKPQFSNMSEVAIIPHCCNTLGVMGAGVALALKNKWPEVYETYKRHLMGLGNASFVVTEELDENVRVMVANMIGQDGTVSADNPKPVKYWALASAMKIVLAECQAFPNSVIHTPKFGSDLAGGDWNFILELIREIWLENGIDVIVYEFRG
jgi:O-acetyl-ADP-ribose deacetylase (regulator of RNase III)